jgi:sRNA-binding protein
MAGLSAAERKKAKQQQRKAKAKAEAEEAAKAAADAEAKAKEAEDDDKKKVSETSKEELNPPLRPCSTSPCFPARLFRLSSFSALDAASLPVSTCVSEDTVSEYQGLRISIGPVGM